MSLYINSMLADEHRAELVRTAAAWRRRREAKQAAAAARAVALRRAELLDRAARSVYCHRAAAAGMRGVA